MKRKIWIGLIVIVLGLLSACGNSEKETESEPEELHVLRVDFDLPEHAEVNETVLLKAVVSYGEEAVKDANEVQFEYWEQGKEKDSKTINAKNNADGTYTAEVTFDKDGIYEIYAHTTARDMHSMPKKSITVGNGAAATHDEGHEEGHEHSSTEGFSMHFEKPDSVKQNQKVPLTVHLQLGDQPLVAANVRYEIYQDGSEKHDWVDAKEAKSGEYSSAHSFTETGKYTIVIHVTNDDGLHEHQEQEIEVVK
ncbi:FixH family protein [Ornithinibacillus bavariensis]|uniref:FixH family protein n=1 Tax=Ornithinibacillus bavariensis TaxID=545502 RepID=UPI000EF05A6E|nr:hypothetical protein [Ornithinibacillus sp.]